PRGTGFRVRPLPDRPRRRSDRAGLRVPRTATGPANRDRIGHRRREAGIDPGGPRPGRLAVRETDTPSSHPTSPGRALRPAWADGPGENPAAWAAHRRPAGHWRA